MARGLAMLPFGLDIRPMEARLVASLPTEPGWQFEPKWDGFRCLAFRSGNVVELRSKSGTALGRYFPEIVAILRWLDRAGGALDGVVAKRVDGPYLPGERAMVKIKHLRTADCVVGGFRYATDRDVVGSLLLGLYNDEGRLDHVGFTSAIPARDRE